MSATPRKRLLLLVRRAPYGSALARAAVDLGLAMGAFEQDFDLLFLGEGVLQLLSEQAGDAIGVKTSGKMLASLPLYDVDRVFVDAAALARFGLAPADLVVPVEALDAQQLRQKLSDCDHIVGC